MPPIDETAYFTRHMRPPFDAAGGFDTVMDSYRTAARETARLTGTPLVDLAQILTAAPGWLSPDGVHPTAKGQELIAAVVLAAIK
jgi:lysophospholipase L1-like esterase